MLLGNLKIQRPPSVFIGRRAVKKMSRWWSVVEKGVVWSEIPRKHASGDEAHADSVRVLPGDKSPAYHPNGFFSEM